MWDRFLQEYWNLIVSLMRPHETLVLVPEHRHRLMPIVCHIAAPQRGCAYVWIFYPQTKVLPGHLLRVGTLVKRALSQR